MEKFETFKVEAKMLEETYQNAIKKVAEKTLAEVQCSSIEEILEARAALPFYCEALLVERMKEWIQPPITDGWKQVNFFGNTQREAAKFEFSHYEFESLTEPYTGHHLGIALASVYNITIHGHPLVTAPHSVYLNEEGAPHIIGFEMEGVKTIFEPLRIDY